ncbi:hypothetical protein M422DRAFT_37734 [Sphaerobolus stellatus SS14]|uniref:Uncharacterized protein n=1 Tax=Sphaerobolus stellatus (strain SS14) TaxID=990650 RepID=A0A0C9TE33_SPHS4|nr:hypothetical protein M422DRAFT_37734 [Sphaerobolus stellatus SS14]
MPDVAFMRPCVILLSWDADHRSQNNPTPSWDLPLKALRKRHGCVGKYGPRCIRPKTGTEFLLPLKLAAHRKDTINIGRSNFMCSNFM